MARRPQGGSAQEFPELEGPGPFRMKHTWYGPYHVIEWGGPPNEGVKKHRGDVFDVGREQARVLLELDRAVVLA